jgi:hypothetical protein
VFARLYSDSHSSLLLGVGVATVSLFGSLKSSAPSLFTVIVAPSPPLHVIDAQKRLDPPLPQPHSARAQTFARDNNTSRPGFSCTHSSGINMGTLTAGCPRLDSHCPHKLPTSCRLTSTPNCCACADERPHSRTYSVYIDGVGFVQRGTRWQSYCWFCKGVFSATILLIA